MGMISLTKSPSSESGSHKPPVVIIGGSITSWGVIRGLRDLCVPIYMISDTRRGIGTLSRYVREVCYLNSSNQNYISEVIYFIENKVAGKPVLMIAGDDDALAILSKHYEALTKYAIPTFPNWEKVSIVINKEKSYAIAQKIGISTIKTRRIESEEELENYLSKDSDSIDYPVFMKCSFSRRFSSLYQTKGVVCYSEEEIRDAYQKFDGFLEALLLQEYLHGDIDRLVAVLLVLDRKSEVKATFVNEKIRAPRVFGSTSLSSSMWNQDLVERAATLAKAIGYIGKVSVQFKFDPKENDYKFLEINGRFSVSVALSQKCGINLPLTVYNEFRGEESPSLEEFQQKYLSNVLLWFPLDDIVLLFQKRFYRRPIHYLRSLIGKGYLIEPFSWRDPKPFFYIFATRLYQGITFFPKLFLRWISGL